jgi:hypothetical protein
MGTVITFPASRHACRSCHPGSGQAESATIIILPVVRIERCDEGPSDGLSQGSSSGRKRRRPATRS